LSTAPVAPMTTAEVSDNDALVIVSVPWVTVVVPV
jgi:hypothetical protein